MIPAALPQSAPVSARTTVSAPQNPDAEGPGKDSFAAAFESAQRPATAPEAAEAPAVEEKPADPAAIIDPSAANPAAAAVLLGVVPGVPTPLPSPSGVGGRVPGNVRLPEASPAPGVALTAVETTLPPVTASQPTAVASTPTSAQRVPNAGSVEATADIAPSAVLQTAGAATSVSQAGAATSASQAGAAVDFRPAEAGPNFSGLLVGLGLKPAADTSKPAAQPVAQVGPAAAGDATAALVPTAALPAADADASMFQLPDVPGLVVDQNSAADGEAASPTAAGAAAGVNQPPQAAARTHAGVLHLDTQLPVHSPRFSEGFTQQVVVLAQNGIQQAQMSLSPPDLGPIDVRITMQQDNATVQIAAASAVAREAIQDALPKLRDMLDQSGVRLNDAGVFAQLPQREQSSGSQQQRSDWRMANAFGSAPGAEQPALLAPVVRRVGLLDAYA